jgi:hypothetical protein
VTGLSEREANLIAAAIDPVGAARRAGDEHVSTWHDAILRRTPTPAPADVAELVALRRKVASERVRGADIFRARVAGR